MRSRRSLAIFVFTSALALASASLAQPAIAQQAAVAPAGGRAAMIARHVPDAVAAGRAQRISDMPGETRLDIVLALPTRNQPELDSLLSDLQNPASPRFHQYITPEQYTERFAATQADYDQVVAFARRQGFTEVATTSNRHLVTAFATVDQINRAFHVRMGVYQHPTEDRTFFSTDREPTVSGLGVKLVEVGGLNNFVRPHNQLKHRPAGTPVPDVTTHAGSGPGGQYIPSDMRKAYYGGTALDGTGVNVAILGFGSIKASDLTLFTTKTGETLPVPITYPSFTSSTTACEGAGKTGTGCDDGEQTLDVEQVEGMAPGTSNIYFYAAEYNSATSDLPMINAIANDNLGKIVTCSWGWTPTNQTSEDASFQQMQAQGQTFMNASGDAGAYTASNIAYPSANPYILEVGATDLTTNGAGGSWASETAWVDSSGGYSPVASLQYPIPAWQQFAGVITSANKGSTTLRNDPDVAAEGNFDNYICDNGKCSSGEGGTSYAAPRWAGYLALVEQQSIANGNGLLGFFPPLLYRIGVSNVYTSNLHDVTSGNNGKFTAQTGFDLVTGWGSPNGATLINTLAAPVFAISPTSGTTATSFGVSINYPDITGTANFYAKPTGTAVQVASCTVTTTVGTSSGCSSSFTGSALGVGTYSGYVVYTETATYNGTVRTQTKTSSSIPFTISDPVRVSAVANPSTITTAQSSTISVTVSDTATSTIVPSGSVSFKTGSTSLGSCTLSGGTCSVMVAGSTLGTGTYTITPTFTGTGFTTGSTTSASLTVNAVPTNVLTFSSVTHNMGSVPAGSSTSGTSNYGVKVTNSSTTLAYTGFAVSFGGSNPSSFSQTNNCPASIAAGASCEIVFAFAPATTGSFSATWSVSGTTNGFSYSPSNGGTLTGTGTTSGTGGVTLTTGGHNFGTVTDGTTSPVYGTVLTNSTSSAVTVSFTTVTSPFHVTLNNCPATLAANASCNLQFDFAPTAPGITSQTFGISVNGGSTPITTGGVTVTGVKLTGTGQ